ncbi:MAG: prenyltransferase/squalene oxidase repeat-containing protein [Planctomycetota bacterium]
MHVAEQQTWRNISRHEETFNDVLYTQLKKTPWWLISIAFHGILVVGMFTMDFGPGPMDPGRDLTSQVEDDTFDPLEEPIKPQIDETEFIDQPEEVIDEPVVKDAKVSDHTETDNDKPFDESLSRENNLGDAPFDGPSSNAAIGVGGGAGGALGGRGGNENLKAYGGGRTTRNAADLGLKWLKDHQDRDGYWDCDGFMKHDQVPPVCDGAGQALYDPGVSGLALLAFLGAGQTHRHGDYKKTVKTGLRYLKQVQDPEGCFGPRTDGHYVYNHAIAAMAMAEAYGMTGSVLFKQSAQQAIDFIHKAQNPYLAWRYGVRPQDNDSSVTGWMIMALKSAKVSGLRVSQDAFDGCRAWIEKATEPEYGRVGYTARGTGPARPEGMMDQWPADKSESLTAVGILARIFTGEDPRKSEVIGKGVDLCLKALPVWDEESGSIDMYYWYYATLGLFQVGGDAWDKWNDAMKPAIIDSQRKDQVSFKGSWDPAGPWGHAGGRVYSTAVMVMCMEVYGRYSRLFQGKRR